MKSRLFTALWLALLAVTAGRADSAVGMRRPVDVEHPMFIVHIDTWNYPDPQKIIDLVPEDLRPWCVFNISLSISHDEQTGVFNLVRNGYETARSWVSTCAQNRVWCMVQPASGGFSHLPDGDMTLYETFFRDFPNFLGFNYCEQFWGFNDRFSVTVTQRLAHFAQLMDLAVRYGGYLVVSWCGGIWHFDTDPVAMMKRNSDLKAICREHPDNFILCLKYTSAACWYNNESVCLGAFISGLTNHYGVRFDECGWALADGEQYPTAVGIGAVMENTQLTGMTVFDGPELIWRQCFREAAAGRTPDGYTSRRWERFPQLDNIWFDFYRKILDGTLRIPTRREVMEHIPFALSNDVSSGSAQDMYATPSDLYDGLYKQDGEGSMQENTHWFKKTGRYGSIPVVTGFYDTDATVIPIRLRASQYRSRWATTQAKVDELNRYAPEEYEGTLYAGRMKNAWVTYYPFRYGTSAWARIPFKYNTCERMELTYAEYSAGLIHEYTDHVDFYLNNYRVDSTELKTDEVRIYGAASEPTIEWRDRSTHQPSRVVTEWTPDGVYIIKVSHCGAVDLTVHCSAPSNLPSAPSNLPQLGEASAAENYGAAEGADASGAAASPSGGRLEGADGRLEGAPLPPPVYTGPTQYEAECFDYKNIDRIVSRPYSGVVEGHVGQGYLVFGTSGSAMVKDTVTVPVGGRYRLQFRYCAPDADARQVMLYLNTTAARGSQGRLEFARTGSGEWSTAEKEVTLSEGANVVYLRANTSAGTPQQVLIDYLRVESAATDGIGEVMYNEQCTMYNGACYDLQGRRVAHPQKGLYVIGGRKVPLK